jgi:hypothetical protein
MRTTSMARLTGDDSSLDGARTLVAWAGSDAFVQRRFDK